MSAFEGWEGFYLIVGGAAGALIGLQFVVLTLIAERPVMGAAQASAAFATPTIVHFSAALLLSALVRVPWDSPAPAAVLWGLVGFFGLIYIGVVTRRMKTQDAYKPDFEDRLFHALLPAAAYALLIASALSAGCHARCALFGVAASALLLLFIGIHNAWDAVVYHVFFSMNKSRKPPKG